MFKYQQNVPPSRGLGSQLLALLGRAWPSVCCICAHPASGRMDLCQDCLSHFPYLDITVGSKSASSRFMTLCIACGLPQPVGVKNCQTCVNSTSPYAQMVVPFRYSHPVDRMIASLKYSGRLSYSRVLGGLLADEVVRTKVQMPDVLLPMPMHQARYRQRGFNQAQEIAYWCGSHLGIELRSDWAGRRVDTPALAGLNKASRELEIRGAFKVGPAVEGRHIAIVDDVLTTGASSTELTRELYDSGAAKVSLWVVARTASSGVSHADFINMRLSEAGSSDSSKLPWPDTNSES